MTGPETHAWLLELALHWQWTAIAGLTGASLLLRNGHSPKREVAADLCVAAVGLIATTELLQRLALWPFPAI